MLRDLLVVDGTVVESPRVAEETLGKMSLMASQCCECFSVSSPVK